MHWVPTSRVKSCPELLEKNQFLPWLKTTIPVGGLVGCLDNLEIRLSSFQLCWNLTELGKMNCTIDFLEQKSTIPAGGRVGWSGQVAG